MPCFWSVISIYLTNICNYLKVIPFWNTSVDQIEIIPEELNQNYDVFCIC